MSKKIVAYYQTLNGLDEILISNTPITHIHLASIHFGIDPVTSEPYIHLNNKSPYDETFVSVWEQLTQAIRLGIEVKLMVGGAGGGYSSLFSDFPLYYKFLKELIINKPQISGIDLDIEEGVSLNNVQLLIKQLKEDFGSDLTISMAPIQESLENDEPGLGGFSYKDLLKSPEGEYIDYFNVQFYSDYSCSAFDRIVANGYKPEMIVMGSMAGEFNYNELAKTVSKYDNLFGGVFVWEYCFAQPSPKEWAIKIKSLLNKSNLDDYDTDDSYLTSLVKSTSNIFNFFYKMAYIH
jgi:hypothetical protein